MPNYVCRFVNQSLYGMCELTANIVFPYIDLKTWFQSVLKMTLKSLCVGYMCHA